DLVQDARELVQGVPALQSDRVRAQGGGERMLDRVDAPGAVAEAEAAEDDLLELLRRGERERAVQERVVDLLLRGLGDQRDEAVPQTREHLADLGRLHAGL